jgi:hypothetical protein
VFFGSAPLGPYVARMLAYFLTIGSFAYFGLALFFR